MRASFVRIAASGRIVLDTGILEERFTGRRKTAFNAAISVAVIVLLARSPVFLVVLGWFLGPYEETSGAGELSHRVHEVSFGVLFAWALIGALAQWRQPGRNVAGMQQLVLTLGIFTVVVTAVTGRFEWFSLLLLAPVAVAAVLHPAGRRLWLPRFRPSVGRIALALLLLPWLLEAASQELVLAGNRAQGHTTHWAGMAAVLMLFGILSVLAALRSEGHRVVAASVGGGAVLYGIAVTLYPFDASSHHGGPVLVVWGIAWIVLAARRGEPAPQRSLAVKLLAAGLVVGAAFASLVVLIAIDSQPPRVPHNLEAVPGLGPVAWADADRATCLTCHATGAEGAIETPHPTNVCSPEEFCIGARTDCLGCHAYDPRLGGVSWRGDAVNAVGWIGPGPGTRLLGSAALARIEASLSEHGSRP